MLELPPGRDWPEVPSELDGDLPESVMYQEGIGQQGAQFEWYCAWAGHGLVSGNKRDLNRLEGFKQMSIWSHIDDVGHNLYERIHDGIAAGDLEPLREYVSNNCA